MLLVLESSPDSPKLLFGCMLERRVRSNRVTCFYAVKDAVV